MGVCGPVTSGGQVIFFMAVGGNGNTSVGLLEPMLNGENEIMFSILE